jgi:hypothetical protein
MFNAIGHHLEQALFILITGAMCFSEHWLETVSLSCTFKLKELRKKLLKICSVRSVFLQYRQPLITTCYYLHHNRGHLT